jgi:hypothetical protein
MGLFGGGTKVSSASAATYSGVGAFQPVNSYKFKKPMIDFSEPMQIVSLVSVIAIGLYAWKRFK